MLLSPNSAGVGRGIGIRGLLEFAQRRAPFLFSFNLKKSICAVVRQRGATRSSDMVCGASTGTNGESISAGGNQTAGAPHPGVPAVFFFAPTTPGLASKAVSLVSTAPSLEPSTLPLAPTFLSLDLTP